MSHTQQNNAPSLINETTPNHHKTTQVDCFAIINEIFQPFELLCSNVISGHQYCLDNNISAFASLCLSILNNSKQLMINFVKLIVDEIGDILIKQYEDGSRKIIIKNKDNGQYEYINKIHPIVRRQFENALKNLYESFKSYNSIIEILNDLDMLDDYERIEEICNAHLSCQQAIHNLEQFYLNIFKKKDSIPEW